MEFGLLLEPGSEVPLKDLVRLKELCLLSLWQINSMEADLKGLTKLQNLRALNLHLTKVTDDAVKQLVEENLQELNLSYTRVD